MLLIGSVALGKLGYTVTPKDIDLVAYFDETQEFIKRTKPKVCYPLSGDVYFLRYADGTICEIEIAWPDSRAEKLLQFVDHYCNQTVSTIRGQHCFVPEFNLLYLLKLSHRYLKDSPHFLKTLRGIQWFRQEGATIPSHWQEFLKEREKLTYTYKHPKLAVDKSTFFDQVATGVKYTYDHDSIHRAVALDAEPAYLTYSIEGEEVLCSKEKFFAAEEYVRLKGVIEESMVLALERSLVPFPGKKTPEEAFLFALQKVCTSITSGWFREYAWENYDRAVQMFYLMQADKCYTERFRIGLENGIVLPNQEGAM